MKRFILIIFFFSVVFLHLSGNTFIIFNRLNTEKDLDLLSAGYFNQPDKRFYAVIIFIILFSVLIFYLIHYKLKSKYKAALDQEYIQNGLRFYAGISQEFKKSLTLIHSIAEILSSDDRLSLNALEHVNDIKRITFGLLDLIAQEIKGVQTEADDHTLRPFGIRYLEKRVQNIIDQMKILKEDSSFEKRYKSERDSSSKYDQKFISNVMNKIEENLLQSDFSIDKIVAQLGHGRTVFYKKMKALTGRAPHDFVRIIKMKKAAEMLIRPGCTIAGISYELGYNDPDYFSKIFKNFFGETPSEYQRKFR